MKLRIPLNSGDMQPKDVKVTIRGRGELLLFVGSLKHFLRRHLGGSPRSLTPQTSRRPKHCWKSWGGKLGIYHAPTIRFAQICQETGKE